MEQIMFGNILSKARDEADLGQKEVADLIGKSRPTVSRYENEERVPPDHVIDALVGVLEMDEEDEGRLREAVSRARDKTEGPSGAVDEEDKLNPWLDAVLASEVPGDAQLVLANLRKERFLDRESWVATATESELADEAPALKEADVESAIQDALSSPFLERVGNPHVKWVFRLTFPKEE